MFGLNQALDWGGCGRQRSLAGHKAKSHLILYRANFPGLGRGLFGLKQRSVWGGCGRQRSLSGYKAKPHVILYGADFPGLGRGLRGAFGGSNRGAGDTPLPYRQTLECGLERQDGVQGP